MKASDVNVNARADRAPKPASKPLPPSLRGPMGSPEDAVLKRMDSNRERVFEALPDLRNKIHSDICKILLEEADSLQAVQVTGFEEWIDMDLRPHFEAHIAKTVTEHLKVVFDRLKINTSDQDENQDGGEDSDGAEDSDDAKDSDGHKE